MSEIDIKKQALKIFEDILELDPDTVRMEQTFEDLEIDSILFIRLVVQCETEFNLQFEDEMLLITKFPDVGTYVEYIQSRYGIAADNAHDGGDV